MIKRTHVALVKVLLCVALLTTFGSGMGCDEDQILEETTYEQVNTWIRDGANVVIIDVRESADFVNGHIQNAINIPLSTLRDEAGQLINGGQALTNVIPEQDTHIVTYCFGWGNELTFAQAAADLGYTKVYYYTGGTEEWDTKPNYYVVEFEGFKAWHAANAPFDNGTSYLVDDLPPEWYAGTDPDHPDGHIPCAVNLPIEEWATSDGQMVNNGAAFESAFPNKNATVVIYCGNSECGKSLVGVQVAATLGYTDVYRYQGGQKEWIEMGEPTVPGQEPCPDGVDIDTDTGTDTAGH
ncbi:MAG: rhodanese-like domain-containing protein [Myxococcota bacterium]|nr:rhodanese-like domain-containing protein [Myxococcota bacterium]